MSKFAIISLIMVVLSTTVFASEVVVKRERTYMRSGPTSFHQIISEIPINSRLVLLEKQDAWLQVKYGNQVGFISESATISQRARNDVFSNISKGEAPSTAVSKHSISAGVKGFGERWSANLAGDKSFIERAISSHPNFVSYPSFKAKTYSGVKEADFRKAWKLSSRNEPDFYTEIQDGFGLAVATVIAKNGIYKNSVLEEYISYVGHMIIEASDVPDMSFRFFVLDIPQPNAYACPGGYIFITRGMLKAMQNEAELAFVLAHEIAHVSRFHGIAEAQKRKHHISSESAFDELDQALPDAFSESGKKIEEELEGEIFKIFETLIEGRLDQYEEEADNYAILYMARTGYDPKTALNLLSRLSQSSANSNNQHYRRDSIRDRITWLQPIVSRYSKTKLKYFSHPDRYQSYQRQF